LTLKITSVKKHNSNQYSNLKKHQGNNNSKKERRKK